MEGKNQHHIPQMLQRGFHAHGERDWTWQYTRIAEPEFKKIKEIGGDDWFYSEPPVKGERTLDREITNFENTELSTLLRKLKASSIGTPVSMGEATLVVAHLAMRAGHFRDVLKRVMINLVTGVGDVLGNETAVKSLLGLDGFGPSVLFHDALKSIEEQPAVKISGIPSDTVGRMVFTWAKENLHKIFAEQQPVIKNALGICSAHAEELVRDSHNKALAHDIRGTLRCEKLGEFVWTVEAAPQEGVILPDCVVIGLSSDGSAFPYMLADQEALAIIMPLSAMKMLVGRKDRTGIVSLSAVNALLAECCDKFFIAAKSDPVFSALSRYIGSYSSACVSRVVDSALQKYHPQPQNTPMRDTAQESSAIKPLEQNLNFELSLLGCGDAAWAACVEEAIRGLIGALGQYFPLERLDGITFAADYPAALKALDRGIPGVHPPETASKDVGTGIAMSPVVVRNGILKCRVIIASWVADALISENEDKRQWGIHTLVNQLALVSMLQLVDECFPNTLMKPLPKIVDGFLFSAVYNALNGYVAARDSSCFAPTAYDATLREMLVYALRRAQEVIPSARLNYRFHGDLDRLLSEAVPAIANILEFAADLLGNCDGLGRSPFDEEGSVSVALEKCGLRAWFAQFQADLDLFWHRVGKWESFDEFLSFNRHVERIAWQFGLVPFETAEGKMHISVPIGSDLPKLIEAAAHDPTTSQKP